MSRAFFDQVDDELRGFLGPSLRNYQAVRGGRLLKVWHGPPPVHFEVQLVGPRWSPLPGASLEIGLHLEYADPAANDRILAGLADPQPEGEGGGPGDRGAGGASRGGGGASGPAWAAVLPRAVAGVAIGPRAGAWRRVSEFMAASEIEDPELASEAAETLACYVRTLWPLLVPLVGEVGDEPG
ncbi:MAG: hypothetical protein ACRDJU_08930 [Actinomycetota bacterium]